MDDVKPEPWMVACAREIVFGCDLGLDDDEYAVLAAKVIAVHAPKSNDQPKERTPNWHLNRAYALLFKASLTDPVAGEASAMIEDASRLLVGKDEPQPIRRGDVVQCIIRKDADDPRYGPFVGDTYVVVRVNDGGWLQLGHMSFVSDPTRFVCIGRAKFYPDGTPVED